MYKCSSLIKKHNKTKTGNPAAKPFGDSEGRKKEYIITTQGKEIAEKELVRLNELVIVANGIIGGAV